MENDKDFWKYLEEKWLEELNRPRKTPTYYMNEAGIKIWEEVLKKEQERLNIKIDEKRA